MSRKQRSKGSKRIHHPHKPDAPGAWAQAMANWPTTVESTQITDRTGTPPVKLRRKGQQKQHQRHMDAK